MRNRPLLMCLIIACATSASANSSSMTCDLALAPKLEAPAVTSLLASNESDKIADDLMRVARENPGIVKYSTTEYLDQIFAGSLDRSSKLLDFLHAENAKNSMSREVEEITSSLRVTQSTHSRLMTLLEPNLWSRLIGKISKKDSSIHVEIAELSHDLTICQLHSATCSAKLKEKIKPVVDHVRAVSALQLRIAQEVAVLKEALNKVGNRQIDPIALSDIFRSAEQMITSLGFIQGNLQNHVAGVSVEIENVDSAIASIRTMQALVDAAIQRGVPYSAKLLATEAEIYERARGSTITIAQEKVLTKASKIDLNAERLPLELIAAVAKIPNHRATNIILDAMANIYEEIAQNYSRFPPTVERQIENEKQIAALAEALKTQEPHPDMQPAFNRFLKSGANQYRTTVLLTLFKGDEKLANHYIVRAAEIPYGPSPDPKYITEQDVEFMISAFERNTNFNSIDQLRVRMQILLTFWNVKSEKALAFAESLETRDWGTLEPNSLQAYEVNRMKTQARESAARIRALMRKS